MFSWRANTPLHIRQEENLFHVKGREVSKWMGGIPAMEMEYRILNVFISREKGEDSISKNRMV